MQIEPVVPSVIWPSEVDSIAGPDPSEGERVRRIGQHRREDRSTIERSVPGAQEGVMTLNAICFAWIFSGVGFSQTPEEFIPPMPPPVTSPEEYAHHTGHGHHRRGRGLILGAGPGDGWGFPNGAPDGYGWYAPGPYLPLNADRTPEYYFPRYFAVPAQTMFFPTYYNKYLSRGQRYLPYSNCGGVHPAGRPPEGNSEMPFSPYEDASQRGPQVEVPEFTGEVQAKPVNPGDSNLIP
jgi:hypothetical protein